MTKSEKPCLTDQERTVLRALLAAGYKWLDCKYTGDIYTYPKNWIGKDILFVVNNSVIPWMFNWCRYGDKAWDIEELIKNDNN